MEQLVRGLVVATIIVSTVYVFIKTLQLTNSFVKALLAVSILIDFNLVILWMLGIDRPLFVVTFQRLGVVVTVTVLTLTIPFKIFFTLWIFNKTRVS